MKKNQISKFIQRHPGFDNLTSTLKVLGRFLSYGLLIPLLISIQGCDEDDPVVPDKPTDQVKQQVGPAGGTLVLNGGVTVVIPPDAMASTKEITISKYKAEDYFDGDVSRYVVIGCAPEGETFSKPVEIYFTAPADLHTGDIGGVAGLIVPVFGAIEVYPTTGLTIDGKNTIRIETSHFSKYAGHFWESPPDEAETMEIPHYNQGDSPYCWAACMHMACEAVKHDEHYEMHDIIGYNAIRETGIFPDEFRYNSKIADYIKARTGINPDRMLWPKGSDAMFEYIKGRLALGFPVIFSSPTEEHAFMVVGYNGATFYLNDPGSIQYNGMLCYTARTKAEFKVNQLKEGEAFVTISIPKAIDCSYRLQTINLSDHGLSFVEPKPDPAQSPAYFYRYNYQNLYGYSFKDKNDMVFDIIPGNVKEMRFTGLQLCNASQTLSKMVKVWIYISGLNNLQIHETIEPENTITLAPNSYKTYDITIPIADFADGTPNPTDYKVEIVALEPNGAVLDETSFLFTMAPPPSAIQFSCDYQVEYADGDFGSTAIEGDIEGEPLELPGAWAGTVYKASDEATFEGIVFKRSIVVNCNANQSKVNSFELKYIIDDLEDVIIRGENIDLELKDNVYQFDLMGEDACTPLTELYFGDDIFGEIVDYFCDETSFLKMRIPR